MGRTFWITALIALANALSFTILIPILYLYGKQFGLTDFQTSLLFSIYAVSQFFSTPVIGKISDRVGRKPLLLISLAGTVVANFLAGTTSTAAVLFFARFLDGITGGNVSVTQAVVSDIVEPQNRAKAFGIYSAITFGLGFILGPALSFLAQKVSLGAGFLTSSGFALVALIIATLFLPETLKTKAKAPENIFDLGLGNLVRGLTLPKIGILLIINFLIGTTFTIFTFAFQPYFIHILGQNSQSLTLMFVMFGILAVTMQAKGIPFLTARFGLVKIFLAAILVRSLSFMVMPIVPSIYYFIAVSVIFSLFNSLVQPMVITLISLNANPENQGTALGLNASYLNVSNAFGPIIAGSIIDQSDPHTYAYPLYLAGVLTFAVFLFAIAQRDKYTPRPLSGI
ncbi:MFS transporter [Leptodesmis sichuanensis]|uniref:MFS transporter n=1 Tax=Leptodesmis sichuanensis TaxID=2906798 RepID=UPI001F2077C6|nr:MFS transporter [Leptodesmis sichuanensis]UIE38345.1 MFS transporter [Leptodesmis sichuanensis A121]